MEQLLKHLKNGGKAYHTPNGDFVIDVKDVKEWLKDKDIKIISPVHEYMWYNDNGDVKWWTKEESTLISLDIRYYLAKETKRERKQ